MPIYEFRCSDCKAEFEKLVMGNSFDYKCVSCGSKKIEKKFSAFSYSGGEKGQASSGPSCGGCTASSCAPCKGY